MFNSISFFYIHFYFFIIFVFFLTFLFSTRFHSRVTSSSLYSNIFTQFTIIIVVKITISSPSSSFPFLKRKIRFFSYLSHCTHWIKWMKRWNWWWQYSTYFFLHFSRVRICKIERLLKWLWRTKFVFLENKKNSQLLTWVWHNHWWRAFYFFPTPAFKP